MTTNYSSLIAHLEDLEKKSKEWHTSLSSGFLNEEELEVVKGTFRNTKYIDFDGGYENARKKKVIFRYDEEDDFSDVVCLRARIDQRFRKITHRDILGAIMNLQVERSSFGDFWVDEDTIYLYTSENMAQFYIDHLTKINQLNVEFEISEDRVAQIFETEEIEVSLPSLRYDAIVSKLAHCSRQEAKEMIERQMVLINHMLLEDSSDLCNNNNTISIRGVGRFLFDGVKRETKNGNLVCVFLKSK